MDTKRGNIGTFYAPSAILVYEVTERRASRPFLLQISKLEHARHSLDAQPIDNDGE